MKLISLVADYKKKKKKKALVKSLVTSHIFHENLHVPYENVEKNPRISSRKIIVTTEFCHLTMFSKEMMRNEKIKPTH